MTIGKKNGNGYDGTGIEIGSTSWEELISKKMVGDIHSRLMASLFQLWADHQKINAMVEVGIYARITILSLTQMAAMTAVDVGMGEEQFVELCLENYREAHRRAPKFG